MKRLLRGQFRLADLLLIVFVIAAWTGFVINRERVEQLEKRVQSMRQSAGELVIQDTSAVLAIAKTMNRYSDEAWQVYLPKDRAWRLYLVTRGVQDKGFPKNESLRTAEIAPGLHEIHYGQERVENDETRIRIAVDRKTVIEVREAKDWGESGGSSATGIGKSQESVTSGEPFVLKRLRMHDKQPNGSSQAPPPDKPANGFLLWIEQVPKP